MISVINDQIEILLLQNRIKVTRYLIIIYHIIIICNTYISFSLCYRLELKVCHCKIDKERDTERGEIRMKEHEVNGL